MSKYGVKHFTTAVYSPQANSSERVNRSLIAAIRSYLKENQKDWDNHLVDISMALRSSYHSAIQFSPFYALFGHQMILNGDTYALLRKLDSLGEGETVLEHPDKLQAIRTRLMENLKTAYEANQRTYNLRSRVVQIKPGDIVFRRNFAQSNKAANFNAKLAPKFLKAKVLKCIGNCLYELQDDHDGKINVYHAKDIQRHSK